MSILFFRSIGLKLLLGVWLALSLVGCSVEAKKARIMERAGKHFAAGDYDKARIEYLNVLQLDPNEARANEQLGIISLEQGSPIRAVSYFSKVQTLEPNNLAAREKLVRALITIGKIGDARRAAVGILQTSPTRGEALYALSETIRNKSDHDVATQAFERFSDRNSPWFLIVQGHQLFLKGDAAGAMDALQRAKRLDENSAVVRAALGAMYLRQNDQKNAAAELQKAAELSPVRSQYRIRYAEYLSQTGAIKEAKDYLADLIAKAPDFLTPKYHLGRIHLAEKNFEAADGLAKDILGRDGSHIDAYILRAHVLLAKNETPKAIEELTALRKSFPGLGVIAYHLARLHLVAKQPDLALAVLTDGVGADPDYVDGVLLLAELKLRAGKTNEALEAISSVVQSRPTLVQGQVMLINALHAAGRLDDVARVLREQIRVYPADPQPHLRLARLLLQQKQPAEARASMEKALEVSPNYVLAHNDLLDLDLREKKFDAALARAQAQKLKNPTAGEPHYFEGKVFAAQRQWDKAEASFQRALEINPNLTGAYDLLLLTLLSSGRTQQALVQLEQTLQKNPADQRALLMSGMIYGQIKESAKAQGSYEKLLALKPDVPVALNNLAYLYSGQPGRLDNAMELATKARALDAESPMIADTLGWILYKRGDYDGALPLLKESAAKLPEEAEVQYHLGMASRMKGENETAGKALRLAVNSAKDFPEKPNARQELARLERGEPPTAAPKL